jgi:hypothetical protein
MQNSCMNSHPIDSWHREFPRIAELRDRLQTTEGTFFHVIPSIIQKSSLAREVYQEHESDLAALDSSFHEKLYNRGSAHTTLLALGAPPRH